jgi:hypothetical protein
LLGGITRPNLPQCIDQPMHQKLPAVRTGTFNHRGQRVEPFAGLNRVFVVDAAGLNDWSAAVHEYLLVFL